MRAKLFRIGHIAVALLFLVVSMSACIKTPEKETETETESESYDVSLCSFYDNFDGDSLDLDKWDFQNGDGTEFGIPGWGNGEAQYYQPQNASVSNGLLTITAKRENVAGKKYTSAKLVTKGRFSQTYGRFEARIRITKALPGLWPAFWMMPESAKYGGWPRSGEIDIMEIKGRLPERMSSTIHFGGGKFHNQYLYNNYYFPDGQKITDFHLYGVEWTEDKLSFSVDGIPTFTVTKDKWYTDSNGLTAGSSAPFDQDFFILLNLAIGGTFDGNRLPPDSDMPAAMQVDFVRVYTAENIPQDDE